MHRLIRRTTLVAIVALAAGCSKGGVATAPAPDRVAPDSFSVAVETTRGPLLLMIYRGWAPHGVDHFYSLLQAHYYDDATVFRVVPKFVVQFGLAANPKLTARYVRQKLTDDSVRQSNVRGTVTYARPTSVNSRTTQLFINLADNPRLNTADGFGFPPIGRVVSGMEFVDLFSAEYSAIRMDQEAITREGNKYLTKLYPHLDHIRKMKVLQEWKRR